MVETKQKPPAPKPESKLKHTTPSRNLGKLVGAVTLAGLLAVGTAQAKDPISKDSLSAKPKIILAQNTVKSDSSESKAKAEPSKSIAKNESASPAPLFAPFVSTKVELIAVPQLGGTTALIGGAKDGKLDDPNPVPVDLKSTLEALGVSQFPANTPNGIYLECKKGTEYFARFCILVPGAKGVVLIDLIEATRARFTSLKPAKINQELAKVGIPETAQPGKDFTTEVSYNPQEKTVYIDFKVGSKYVASYGFDIQTEKIFTVDPPESASPSVGQK